MNYNKYHRPNFCYLSSTAEGLKKGLWFFLKYCKTILSMTTHASCCILNSFWPIITKNVLLSTYFTTDLYHRRTHMATSPPAPVVVFSKGNCLILKRYLKHWWVFLLSLWHRLVTAPSFNEVTQKHRELTPSWALFTQNANRILGCLRKSRSREVSLHPALCSALVRPHLELWGSPYEPDVEVLEWVHEGL